MLDYPGQLSVMTGVLRCGRKKKSEGQGDVRCPVVRTLPTIVMLKVEKEVHKSRQEWSLEARKGRERISPLGTLEKKKNAIMLIPWF